MRKRFFSVDGDVNSIALVIRRWLEKYDRLLSPKFVAGESYGGIRGPKIVRNLQTQQGIGVKGLILVSPVFDFRELPGSSLLQYVCEPALDGGGRARSQRRKGRGDAQADLADVERYARGEFLVDLVKGQADTEATDAARRQGRRADRDRSGGEPQACRAFRRRRIPPGVRPPQRQGDRPLRCFGRWASIPIPDSSYRRFGDPSGDPLMAPLTSAAVDLTTRKLNWRPDGSYQLLSGAVGRAWDFGRGRNPTESVSQLRQILALDPKLKLLVGHGLFDLATPYFGSQIVLDQLPAFRQSPSRVKLVVYPGGHMFYSRDASRQAFRGEVAGADEVRLQNRTGAAFAAAPVFVERAIRFSTRGPFPAAFPAPRRASDTPRCRCR